MFDIKKKIALLAVASDKIYYKDVEIALEAAREARRIEQEIISEFERFNEAKKNLKSILNERDKEINSLRAENERLREELTPNYEEFYQGNDSDI